MRFLLAVRVRVIVGCQGLCAVAETHVLCFSLCVCIWLCFFTQRFKFIAS